MKQLLLLIIITLSIEAQTISIKPLDPVNIEPNKIAAITARVKETSVQIQPTVDRYSALHEIMEEHALNQSGATSYEKDLNLIPADQVITGTAGIIQNQWYIEICLSDVSSGEVLACRSASTSSYKDLLTITGPVTKALLKRTQIEDDPKVTSLKNNQPIIIGTTKQIHEVHVYEHKTGTHNVKRFFPCSFCQGTGKVPCPQCLKGKTNCPYCSSTSLYKGIETHGQFMTGHWR